jgi:DNA-binding transcriptional LysR family regulator
LLRQLRDFELDAAIAHFGPDDRAGLEVVPLYRERYVLLVSGEQLAPGMQAISWTEAAQLPLALLMPHMRFRQFIDKAFAANGVVAMPQVETDSVASLYSHVATGAWASVVPHTWLRSIPAIGGARALRLVEPETTAQISIAIHAGSSSVAARAFVNVAAGARLDESFDRELRDFVEDLGRR